MKLVILLTCLVFAKVDYSCAKSIAKKLGPVGYQLYSNIPKESLKFSPKIEKIIMEAHANEKRDLKKGHNLISTEPFELAKEPHPDHNGPKTKWEILDDVDRSFVRRGHGCRYWKPEMIPIKADIVNH